MGISVEASQSLRYAGFAVKSAPANVGSNFGLLVPSPATFGSEKCSVVGCPTRTGTAKSMPRRPDQLGWVRQSSPFEPPISASQRSGQTGLRRASRPLLPSRCSSQIILGQDAYGRAGPLCRPSTEFSTNSFAWRVVISPACAGSTAVLFDRLAGQLLYALRPRQWRLSFPRSAPV